MCEDEEVEPEANFGIWGGRKFVEGCEMEKLGE
jgi:hypothetical protein